MFVLELRFDDDPRRLAARPAHRQRLAELHAQGRLLAAGPWHDDTGAMLVFRADRDGVRQIMSADPYYATPGVTVVVVARVAADGRPGRYSLSWYSVPASTTTKPSRSLIAIIGALLSALPV